MIALIFTFFLQSVDTLTQAYSTKWAAKPDTVIHPNGLIGLLESHDLAFVVFGVVLIILTLLFTFLFRLDSKLDRIEKSLNN